MLSRIFKASSERLLDDYEKASYETLIRTVVELRALIGLLERGEPVNQAAIGQEIARQGWLDRVNQAVLDSERRIACRDAEALYVERLQEEA